MATTSNDNKHREDTFSCQVQQFDFCGESIDTSLRKLLAKVLLPKEAQQIDRAMEDFAKRYFECNRGLVDNSDMVYAVAFSILLLHTDAHNKNVRQKMNKDTFIMRTKIIEGGENVPAEILDIMYDNIVMSEFTYADGHKESTGRTERSNSWFFKLKSEPNQTAQSASLNADLGSKLEQLMPAENTYSYKRTLKPIHIMDIHLSLLRAKSLCLAGVRSRHGNDTSNNTYTVRVTKAGILDRKYDLIQGGRKATARGWRPFGVILSGSQIIFFADLSSYQTWLHEEESAGEMTPKRNNSFPAFSSSSSVDATVTSLSSLYSNTSNPSLQSSPIPTHTSSFLRPVQIISLSYAICICDEEYKKYPHVFRLITGDGQQFLLRADNDEDMQDWMMKINYASTLKTTGVKLRPSKRPNESARSIDDSRTEHRSREEKAREKVQELTDRIGEQVKLLDRELKLRSNLMVFVPFQKSTKDRILVFAEGVGKRIRTKRIELQRLECYREYLESELTWWSSQQPSRKMSLPLPSHLSCLTTTTSSRRETSKKLSHLVLTRSETSSTPLQNAKPLEDAAITDKEDATTIIDGDNGDDDNSNKKEELIIPKVTSSHSSSSLGSTESSLHDLTPQSPSFHKPYLDRVPLLQTDDEDNTKTQAQKAAELDYVHRRRSQSNPIFPNQPFRPVDKKLLLAPSKNRVRSSSEASSIKDDDDMSVVIVNENDDTTEAWSVQEV
ncbi:hypothetical protein K501DRAFT_253687 [Backusella circina FSU 941]|nr:hypothetical protein K501DRAFT_253687 [Backusella circina FSU 941]